MPKHIPIYDLNIPNGGAQRPLSIEPDTPVYSSYTGNFVGRGPIPFGVVCDAPLGHPKYGHNYHAIVYNASNNIYMTHHASYPQQYDTFQPRTFY